MTPEAIAEVVKEYGAKEGDTGSTSVQVALLTARISELSVHLSSNRKDKSGQRGLQLLVGQRRRLLKYLERTNFEGYVALTNKLGLRRSSTFR